MAQPEAQGDRNPNKIEEMVLAKWDKANKKEKDLIIKLLSDEKMSPNEAKRLIGFYQSGKGFRRPRRRGKDADQ